MLKRKAETNQPEVFLFGGHKISKKAKIPATNSVRCILHHCGAEVADGPFNLEVKQIDFGGDASPKSPFELGNSGWVKRGKNWISLPIQLERSQLSPSWFPTPVNDDDSSNPFEDDVYRCFQRRTRNFEDVDIRVYEEESLDIGDVNLKIGKAFPTDLADHILFRLENEIQYLSGKMAKTKLPFLGLTLKLPRKHVAHGDDGLTFTFDGNTVAVNPWTPLLQQLRDIISQIARVDFNFVLIHRFKNGTNHLHELKNTELFGDADLSVSTGMMAFGSSRQLNLHRWNVSRKRGSSFTVEHGFVLSMNPSGLSSFLHSFPPLKDAKTPTIILHFIKKLPLSV